jgi:spore coat protein U-like protein
MFTKKMSARTLTVAGAIALALGAMSGTQAAVDNIDVTATVTANCTITAEALAFGNYDGIVVNAATAVTVESDVDVTCTQGAAATVTLGQGGSAGGASTDANPDRRLTDGTNFLNYGLFTENTHTDEWGNTAGTGVTHTGTGSLATLVVYGIVPAGQTVPAGNYTDTVVATITL